MTTTAITALVLGEAGFAEGTVSVDGDRITAVALSPEDRAALQRRAAEHVDAVGCWLIPGLIDAHAHGYATLLRGTENSMPLELWALYTVMYGRAYDAAAMRAAILLGAAERIRAGITDGSTIRRWCIWARRHWPRMRSPACAWAGRLSCMTFPITH
jgi:cytosine/adenosine deaminase-related metal-dependent hydrolase